MPTFELFNSYTVCGILVAIAALMILLDNDYFSEIDLTQYMVHGAVLALFIVIAWPLVVAVMVASYIYQAEYNRKYLDQQDLENEIREDIATKEASDDEEASEEVDDTKS